MDCTAVGARIHSFTDGECSYLEAAEVARHLERCEGCAQQLDELRAVRSALSSWGLVELAPSSGFHERVREAFERNARGAGGGLQDALQERLAELDVALGRVALPGGRTIRVRSIIGWGLAAAAIVIGIERHHVRRSREFRPSLSKGGGR